MHPDHQTPSYRALLERIQSFHQPQPDKPDETPEAVLKALWYSAAGEPKSIHAINGSAIPALDAGAIRRLDELVERKRQGVPLAHITGRQSFLGVELLAGPEALIPRRETEILGKAALARLNARGTATPLVIDVCTGSGNLALALAHHVPGARVYAADLSPEAVDLARRNAEFTGLADRVEFRCGDLFAPFAGELQAACQLVTCNPPYISSAKVPKMPAEISAHEPRLAFDGGALGVTIITRLFNEAPAFLAPGGVLAFEVGAGQGPLFQRRLERLPWVAEVEAHRDQHGEIRALVAVKRE